MVPSHESVVICIHDEHSSECFTVWTKTVAHPTLGFIDVVVVVHPANASTCPMCAKVSNLKVSTEGWSFHSDALANIVSIVTSGVPDDEREDPQP